MSTSTRVQRGYTFRLVNIDCLRSSTRFNVVMDLEEPIDSLLPYLAARLPGCHYVHGSGVIDLMEAGHILGIYGSRITITDVADEEEAGRLCARIFEAIEEVRRNREAITPVYEKRPTLTLLQILRGLPKTNCGECGSPTCMAFAGRVFRREVTVTTCPHFSPADPANHALLRELELQGYPT